MTLSDCEDITENEDEDDLPNAILIRFIESQEEYLRKVADGTSHIFRKIRDIESTPFKENWADCFGGKIEKNLVNYISVKTNWCFGHLQQNVKKYLNPMR